MIRLRAEVRSERATKSNCQVDSNHNQANRATKFPVPDSVEIEGGHEGGFILIHVFLREGPFIHTWHPSIQEAKAEAKEDFCIQDEDWKAVIEEGS